MAENRGINRESRLFEFTLKLIASYRLQKDGELTFPHEPLNKALALGLERTFFEYVCAGEEIPESLKEAQNILSFTRGICGIKCIELDEMLCYSHQVDFSHPQPPAFNYERVFIGKGAANRTLKNYGGDEAFLKLASNVWNNVDKAKKGYLLPTPLIFGRR